MGDKASMPADRSKVLVVDDDIGALRLLERVLGLEGYEVTTTPSPRNALGIIKDAPPNMVLLDVRMPEMDGLSVCKHIRQSSQTSVIMLTGVVDDKGIAMGFAAGADDYVTKPFRVNELMARIKAVLKRTCAPGDASHSILRFGGLVVDLQAYSVIVDGREIVLTPTEFTLLAYLAQHAGTILTTFQILDHIWGSRSQDDAHRLEVTVSRLRKKLGDSSCKPKYILTHRSLGYSLKKP